jgi:multidrug efflux system outer membrane protein
MKNASLIRDFSPALLPLVAALLSACAAPAFVQPKVEVPAAYKEVRADAVHTAPELDVLEEQARAGNQKLVAAAARVRQARAIAGIAEADRAPQLGLAAGAQRQQLSPLEAKQPVGTPIAPGNAYQARLSASYEVDLFGRVASNVAAARGDAGAAEGAALPPGANGEGPANAGPGCGSLKKTPPGGGVFTGARISAGA